MSLQFILQLIVISNTYTKLSFCEPDTAIKITFDLSSNRLCNELHLKKELSA